MSVTVANGLVAYLCDGGAMFVLRAAPNADVATRAMRTAAGALQTIPHPDEPEDALPNFVSAVTAEPDGPSFWIDVKDMLDANEALAQQVVDVLVTALDAAGADGELGFAATQVMRAVDALSVSRPTGDADARHEIAATLADAVHADEEKRSRVVDWWLREELPRALARAGVPHDVGDLATLDGLVATASVVSNRLVEKGGGLTKYADPDLWPQGDRPAANHIARSIEAAVGDAARHSPSKWIGWTHLAADSPGDISPTALAWTAIWDSASWTTWLAAAQPAMHAALGYGDDAFHVAQCVYEALEPDLPRLLHASALAIRDDGTDEAAALVDAVASSAGWATAATLHAERAMPGSLTVFREQLLARLSERITAKTYDDVTRSGLAAFGAHCYEAAELLIGGEEFLHSIGLAAWQRIRELIAELL